MDLRATISLALLALSTAAACGPGGTHDAGNDAFVGASDAGDVVAADRTDGGSSADVAPLFSPCTIAAACVGPRSACLTPATDAYPGGLCTRHCAADTDCGSNGICLAFGSSMDCFESCAHGSDCRVGYNCFVSSARPDAHACFPLCTNDAQCAGTTCNTYTGFCGAIDTMLVDDGLGCTSASQCRSGRCDTEIGTDGSPTGYLDGECVSLCTVPDLTTYAADTIPQGNCPGSNVCVPFTPATTGDLGQCLPACTDSSQCRAGFICVRAKIQGTGMYSNGYCAPMNCHYMTQTCPAGATCETTATGDGGVPTNGLCVRSDGGGTTSDASADAGDGG